MLSCAADWPRLPMAMSSRIAWHRAISEHGKTGTDKCLGVDFHWRPSCEVKTSARETRTATTTRSRCTLLWQSVRIDTAPIPAKRQMPGARNCITRGGEPCGTGPGPGIAAIAGASADHDMSDKCTFGAVLRRTRRAMSGDARCAN